LTVDKIRSEAVKALEEAGYQPGSFMWIDAPNVLVLSVRGQVCKVDLPGGMSRVRFERAIGYLMGLAEGARIHER
jgi:hypothetical protein